MECIMKDAYFLAPKELPRNARSCYTAGAKGMSSKPVNLALARNFVSCFF